MPHETSDDSARLQQARFWLKDTIRQQIDFSRTAQGRGIESPPLEKPTPPEAVRFALAAPGTWAVPPLALETAIARRCSHRRYTRTPLSLDEVAFLLWATQGLREPVSGGHAFRTVPSAGCRHAFESYLAVLNVDGLAGGLYRYLPLSHQLVREPAAASEPPLAARLVEATLGQRFAGTAAAVFIWTAIPARMEWRYGLAAHKVMALDAGHVCQNLYLACQAVGAGTCAIAAYDQARMDALLGVDGDEEFTLYLAPVGKIA